MMTTTIAATSKGVFDGSGGDDELDDEHGGGKGGRQIAVQIKVVRQRQDGVISVRATAIAADR